jgi:5-methylcytosine-specific restriction endonuclease McrA
MTTRCLRCRRLTRRVGGRCEHCSKTTARGYGHEHQERARLAIAEQPWCSICGSTTDLTADHIVPIIDGGLHGPLQVLCRSCNSKRLTTRRL